MSQLDLQYTVKETTQSYREHVSSGNVSDLLQHNRQVGVIWAVLGGICGLLMGMMGLVALSERGYGQAFFCLIMFGLMLWLFIYGLRSAKRPESHVTFKRDFLQTQQTICQNTGCPQRPYVSQQWEIPFTEYSEEALFGILRYVNGWGTDNTCLVCNEYVRTRRTTAIHNAFIFNLCERGLYLIPLFSDKNGAPKAYVDLAQFIPSEDIKRVRVNPVNGNACRLSVQFTRPLWNQNQYRMFDIWSFLVSDSIDGADFHRVNVAKLKLSCQ